MKQTVGKNLILFLFSLLTIESCLEFRPVKISGTVEYLVESHDFTVVDNIQFIDVAGILHNTGRVNLPWKYSFSLENAKTYEMKPPYVSVHISKENNRNGGTIRTVCLFSKNFKNDDITQHFGSDTEVNQESFTQVYPNTF